MATLQSPLFAETHSLWSEESNLVLGQTMPIRFKIHYMKT